MYRNIIYTGKATRYDSLLLTLDGEPLITLNILSAAILFADFLLFPCPRATQESIYKEAVLILLHEKFLQFDWLRAVVFQLNLKYLHVKITNLSRVVV